MQPNQLLAKKRTWDPNERFTIAPVLSENWQVVWFVWDEWNTEYNNDQPWILGTMPSFEEAIGLVANVTNISVAVLLYGSRAAQIGNKVYFGD